MKAISMTLKNILIGALVSLSLVAFGSLSSANAQDADEPEQTEEEALTEEGMDEADSMAEEPLMEEGEESQEETSEPMSSFGDKDVLNQAAEADSIFRMWMEVNEYGERPYYFRHVFEIDDPPSSGSIWITADDDFKLYVNGVYIAADESDTLDWMDVKEYDVGRHLKMGENVIAVEAIDVDATRQGIKLGLIYETIPDIKRQLDLMVEKELAAQEEAREARKKALIGEPDTEYPEPTQEELWEMRTIEKNKLY